MEIIPLHVSVAVYDVEQVLLVQEADPRCYGRWNLPGGHVEYGETLRRAARREAAEETGLAVTPTALVGVYTDPRLPRIHTVRFVLAAEVTGGTPVPGDDLLAVRRLTWSEVDALADTELINPQLLRRIFSDLRSDRRHPLEALVEPDAM